MVRHQLVSDDGSCFCYIGTCLFLWFCGYYDLTTKLLCLCALISHYIVPELGPDVKFTYASHKAVNEYKEAKAVSI